MKRNFLVLLCVFAMIATCLASCDKKPGSCEHTFSENWASDATSHWHPATCEHGEIKDSLADHVDADENSICDVCQYDGMTHTHTFEDEWMSDDTHHWHNATCSHTEEKGDYDLHSDGDINGVCDYCEAHVHTMNIIGRCSGCGELLKEVENMDIAMAVYAASENHYKINGGVIDYEFIGRSNTSPDYASIMLQDVVYTYGNGYTYTKTESDTTVGENNNTGVIEGWYEVDGNGVFGVVKVDGGDFELASVTADSLFGYYYAFSTLADGHGAEEILYNLFERSQSENSSGFEYVMGDGSAEFRFNNSVALVNITDTTIGQVINVSYFDVTVKFFFTEDYVLTDLMISIDVYTNDPGTSQTDGFLEDDVDLDYDEKTGKITLRENALADTYTITTTQTIGERTAVNPNPKSSFVPDSFGIFTDSSCETPMGSSASAKVDSFFEIHLGDYKPEGTSLGYVNDYIRFEVFDEEGNLLIGNVDAVSVLDVQFSDRMNGFYSYQGADRYFSILPKTEGVYKFVIYFLSEKAHEVTVRVGVEEEEDVVLGANQFAVEINEAYSWIQNEVSFTAKTAGTYTFTFSDNLSFINADAFDAAYDENGYLIAEEEPEAYYDYQDPFAEHSFSFTLELSANETIRFYTSSDAVGTYVVTYSVD